ncbi:MAG: hypothetical protein KGI75_30720 [Rhizobiaceae bacterium]|nr:hypothetical protein [Rhizobiaceae bacterium]
MINEITGELVDPREAVEHHPNANDEQVWAGWRLATLDELIHAWPAQDRPGVYEKFRGWWHPTLDELREARQNAKSRDRHKRRKRKDDDLDHVDL